MAAEWDTGDSAAETAGTSSSLDTETFDIDPDIENYANGITPDTPHGRRYDSPDGPGDPDGEEHQPGDEHPDDSYADPGDEAQGPEETNSADKPADEWGDEWGDTHPDAENHADFDDLGTGSPDAGDDQHKDEPAPDLGTAADASQPGQDQAAEGNAEGTALSSDQQRINALEAENADANQRIAELEAKNDEQAGRLDRIEQFLADSKKKNPADASAEGHGGDKLPASADHQAVQDAAIAERKTPDEGRNARDAEASRWRRIPSADNVGLASTALGAADTVAQFAMHATPEGVVGLGAMVFGVASLGLAKLEKKRKDQNKA